jgi:hypothetical protein
MAAGLNEQGWCVAIAGKGATRVGGGREDNGASGEAEGEEGSKIRGTMGNKMEGGGGGGSKMSGSKKSEAGGSGRWAWCGCDIG